MITKSIPIGIVLGSLSLFASLPAGATLIVDNLTAHATATAGTTTSSDGPNSGTPTTWAYASAWEGDVWAEAWSSGATNGVYRVEATVVGNQSAYSAFTRTWEITNDTTDPQHYSFSFYIYGGGMNANAFSGGYGFAEYLLDIGFGGNPLFHSAARIDSDGTLTQTGTPLADATQSGSTYSWSGTSITLDLGVLNPGQTSLLQYDLVANAFGNYVVATCPTGYSGYEEEPLMFFGEWLSCTGQSYVFMGDPSGISATPVQSPSITGAPQSVPEPGTLGLFGISLAALMAGRRRARSES